MEKNKKTTRSFREPETETSGEIWKLRLYVAGQTPNSLTAFENLKKICEQHLEGRYHQIIAVPTLIRHLPTPVKKIIGNLSNTEKVLIGLDLRKVK